MKNNENFRSYFINSNDDTSENKGFLMVNEE